MPRGCLPPARADLLGALKGVAVALDNGGGQLSDRALAVWLVGAAEVKRELTAALRTARDNAQVGGGRGREGQGGCGCNAQGARWAA